jgi:hypothetical protein
MTPTDQPTDLARTNVSPPNPTRFPDGTTDPGPADVISASPSPTFPSDPLGSTVAERVMASHCEVDRTTRQRKPPTPKENSTSQTDPPDHGDGPCSGSVRELRPGHQPSGPTNGETVGTDQGRAQHDTTVR